MTYDSRMENAMNQYVATTPVETLIKAGNWNISEEQIFCQYQNEEAALLAANALGKRGMLQKNPISFNAARTSLGALDADARMTDAKITQVMFGVDKSRSQDFMSLAGFDKGMTSYIPPTRPQGRSI